MRPAYLIALAELLAFALGVVVTLWMVGAGSATPAVNPASLVSALTPTSGAVQAQGSAPAGKETTAHTSSGSTSGSAPATSVTQASGGAAAPAGPPGPASSAAPAAADASASSSGASSVSARAPGAGVYALELGFFRTPSGAGLLKTAVNAHGFPANIVQINDGGQIWQSVRLGSFADRMAAAAAKASLWRRTGLEALVIESTAQ